MSDTRCREFCRGREQHFLQNCDPFSRQGHQPESASVESADYRNARAVERARAQNPQLTFGFHFAFSSP